MGPDGTYSVRFGSTSAGGDGGGGEVDGGGGDDGGGEIVSGVPVHFIQVPSKKFEAGVAHAELVKTNKNSRQKGKCMLVSKKKRPEQAEGGESGLEVGEPVELPRHIGRGGGKQWCCLEWLLSEQPDFKAQENAVREYVKSRGHECIFLPKFHPGNRRPPPPFSFSDACEGLVVLLVISPHVTLCSFSELNFIERYWGRAKWYMR